MKALLSAVVPRPLHVRACVCLCVCVCVYVYECVHVRSVFPFGALVPVGFPPGAVGRPLVDALHLAALVFVYPFPAFQERPAQLPIGRYADRLRPVLHRDVQFNTFTSRMLFPDAEICDVAFDKIDFVVAPASPDQVASLVALGKHCSQNSKQKSEAILWKGHF